MTRLTFTNKEKQPSGSPLGGEPVFLVVGNLRKPHGLQGEILMDVITDFPERLKPGGIVYVGQNYEPLRIRKKRNHKQAVLISFETINSIEDAQQFRNTPVYVLAENRPRLEHGEYYHHQIIGIQVISENQVIGYVSEILETGTNDVFVVQNKQNTEILLPAIDPVIIDIDLDLNQMHVHLIPGLLPE